MNFQPVSFGMGEFSTSFIPQYQIELFKILTDLDQMEKDRALAYEGLEYKNRYLDEAYGADSTWTQALSDILGLANAGKKTSDSLGITDALKGLFGSSEETAYQKPNYFDEVDSILGAWED